MNDIVIIGGGIAGLSAAARLAPHARVTLLEAEDALAYHASGRSAAAFLEDYGNATVRALNKASARELREADGGVLSPRGMMLLCQPGQEDAFAAEADSFAMQAIDMAEAERRFPLIDPARLVAAAFLEPVFDLDTDRLIQHYRKAALSHGAVIETRARIDRITREGHHWTVAAGDRHWQGDTLVNAAGAWADHIAGMAGVAPIGIVPHRRSMARIPVPDGSDPSGWAFVHGVGETWYAKPDAGALIVSPSEAEPTHAHDAWADDMTLALGIARFDAVMRPDTERMLANWAGLRSFAPDKALVLGRDPGQPAFVWCAGQGGYGFQTAPAASRLLADRVLGRHPELDKSHVAALAPERFA